MDSLVRPQLTARAGWIYLFLAIWAYESIKKTQLNNSLVHNRSAGHLEMNKNLTENQKLGGKTTELLNLNYCRRSGSDVTSNQPLIWSEYQTNKPR